MNGQSDNMNEIEGRKREEVIYIPKRRKASFFSQMRALTRLTLGALIIGTDEFQRRLQGFHPLLPNATETPAFITLAFAGEIWFLFESKYLFFRDLNA